MLAISVTTALTVLFIVAELLFAAAEYGRALPDAEGLLTLPRLAQSV